MKIIFSLFIFLFSLSLNAQPLQHNDNAYNEVKYKSLPPLEIARGEGVSGHFAGVINNHIWVAGGSNFPDLPLTHNGHKKYYNDIYRLSDADTPNAVWEKVGELPHKLAYGVSVTTPEGMVCLGGSDGEKNYNEVLLFQEDAKGNLEIHDLPSLPIALDNMAGAYGNGYIYIAGGYHDRKPSKSAFRLKFPGGQSWEKLPDFPGKPRIQPCGAVQNNAYGPCFYLIGGFTPSSSDHKAHIHTDGLYYNDKNREWSPVASIEPQGRPQSMALIGATAISSGYSHIVFIGGVNQRIFKEALDRPLEIQLLEERVKYQDSEMLKERLQNIKIENDRYLDHPTDWYKFNDELIIYHTITDTWVTESHSPLLARAGATLVPYGSSWVYINGESKPGIRSADVTQIQMTMRPSFGLINWIVLIAYLVCMIALGYYFMRRESDAEDFFKGGGRIPWWAAGISIYATMLSAITYMAYPAKAYATDWTYYPMLVTILFVSFPVIKYYLPFFRRLNVTSAYEYLERRFNATTRLMASALFIIFMIARMALVLYLPSLALTAVTGIDLYICIVLMAIVTIVYCTMGGVEAVVWGDVIQGFILVGGAFFAVAYLIVETEGGIEGFINIGLENDKFRLFDWSFDYRSATFWVIILGGLANNLISYTSDQTVIQRYLTTKDEKSARHSILMNGVMSVFISIAFFAIGAGLFTFFKTHPAELDYTMQKADCIFPFFMMSQLPQGIAGLLIAAIFAATMSTISSNINSVATAFSVDFYKRFKPNASDKKIVKVARHTCIVSGFMGMGIALLMATWEILSLLDFFQEILGLLSSGLGGLFLMGIFFPRIGGKAALTGFVAGVAVVFMTRYFTETSFLLYGFIGMAVSVAVGYLASFIFKEHKDLDGLTWKQRIE